MRNEKKDSNITFLANVHIFYFLKIGNYIILIEQRFSFKNLFYGRIYFINYGTMIFNGIMSNQNQNSLLFNPRVTKSYRKIFLKRTFKKKL